MRIYTVHVDPVSAARDREAALVPEGFCWPAALFTVFWALYHRLWGWALALAAIGGSLGGVAAWAHLDPAVSAAVQAGYLALVGFHANDWRRRRLARRGYLLADVVAARDFRAAEQRFFDRQALWAR